MARLKFTKASATGNDIILIDNRSGRFSGKERDFFRWLCRRRLGVGADGMILIESSTKADFSIRYFNADGGAAAMCGNGARAACSYMHRCEGLKARHTFENSGKIHTAECLTSGIRISMPSPSEYKTLTLEVDKDNNFPESGSVRVGVPHVVLVVNNTDDIDTETIGRKIRYRPEFPEGVNVNFIDLKIERGLRIRTYERGVEAETLACGTGAVAAAFVLYRLRGLLPPFDVHTSGGLLQVSWKKDFSAFYLQGNVDLIYSAELLSDFT